ncbi:protein Ldb19p [[Candida] railenensis]|uniref:Protein Ldb19p n=1 Tax=[Candida] railenensis TaxID=45579 RepID=A0A9P0VWK3_9ASCO|nr:protein Ldb19p [[Candida] railenensis]
MAILSRVLQSSRSENSPTLSSFSKISPQSSPSHRSSVQPSSISSNGNAHHGKKSSSNSVVLSIKLESPPVILYGQASESTGSIISGLLFLEINSKLSSPSGNSSPSNPLSPVTSRSSLKLSNDVHQLSPVASRSSSKGGNSPSVGAPNSPPPFESVELKTVTLSLVQTIKYTKPFLPPSPSISNCKECAVTKNVLARWDVITGNTSLELGKHGYPFSHLLPGSLPASCKLGSYHSGSFVKYDIIAEAKLPGSSSPITVELPLNISRSILRGPDRNSLRVFPPTEVTASAVLPNVVYPKSTFPIELKLDNIVSEKQDRRWRMRKLTWRIEEQIKVRANACEKHEPKLKALEDAQKKVILSKQLKTGHSSSAAGSNGGENKPSGSMHYSTIQTNMSYTASPSLLLEQQQNQRPQAQAQQQQTSSVRPRDVDEEPEVESRTASAPEESHRSFVEDFVRGPAQVESSTNATTSTAASADGSGGNSPQVDPKLKQEHIYLEEIRTVNHGELKSGWKSDFSGRGKIELVADIGAIHLSSGLVRNITQRSSSDPKGELNDGLRNGANIACDIDDPNSGVFVNHTLIVEVVIAEELLQEKRPRGASSGQELRPSISTSSTASTDTQQGNAHSSPQFGTASGAARVLRMQFKLPVTERSGLGIAWDDEVPPTYEDVRTLSPPTYKDSSNGGTPVIGSSSSSVALPALAAQRQQTPGVIYGIGSTPNTGAFGLVRNADVSIDSVVDLDDQDFRL